MTGSPVVELNRAVAVAEAYGPNAALEQIAPLEASLRDYLWFHTTRGEFLRRLGRRAEAHASFMRAKEIAENDSQSRFIDERLTELDGSTGVAELPNT